jgi:type IV pilus assembly protein PilV
LLQTVNFSIDNNMTTLLRDEALRVADERLVTEKSRVFDAISTNTRNENVSVKVVNAFKNYSIAKTTSSVSNNTKSIRIDVTWKYKGSRYAHVISSLITKNIN